MPISNNLYLRKKAKSSSSAVGVLEMKTECDQGQRREVRKKRKVVRRLLVEDRVRRSTASSSAPSRTTPTDLYTVFPTLQSDNKLAASVPSPKAEEGRRPSCRVLAEGLHFTRVSTIAHCQVQKRDFPQ